MVRILAQQLLAPHLQQRHTTAAVGEAVAAADSREVVVRHVAGDRVQVEDARVECGEGD